MARPPLVNEDERKLPFAVSLSRRQRERFKALGGSKWLQGLLDRHLRRKPTPEKGEG